MNDELRAAIRSGDVWRCGRCKTYTWHTSSMCEGCGKSRPEPSSVHDGVRRAKHNWPKCPVCQGPSYCGWASEICMDCVKSRHKSVLAQGRCVCGKKKIPGREVQTVNRAWTPCERCLGAITGTQRDIPRRNPEKKCPKCKRGLLVCKEHGCAPGYRSSRDAPIDFRFVHALPSGARTPSPMLQVIVPGLCGADAISRTITRRAASVTCPKCLKLLASKGKRNPRPRTTTGAWHIKVRERKSGKPGAWYFLCPGGKTNRLRVHASRYTSHKDALSAATSVMTLNKNIEATIKRA